MADRETSPASDTSILSNIALHTDKESPFRDPSTASPPMSTPPTSLGDEVSILSDVTKVEHIAEVIEDAPVPQPAASAAPPQSAPDAANSESKRPSRSSRKSVTTYNVQILAGTAIHTPTKYLEKHHKNVLHGSLEALAAAAPATTPKKRTPRIKAEQATSNDPAEQQLAAETAQAAQRRTSSRTTAPDLRRSVVRSGVGEAVANKISGGISLVKSVLKRSASDSRLRATAQSGPAVSAKRRRTIQAVEAEDEEDEEEDDEEEEEKTFVQPKTKKWLEQGLFVGQNRTFDARYTEKENRARRKARGVKENSRLPLPMFGTERMLNEDPKLVSKAFKLPFDVYNPLPRKVKVDGWVKISKNRFIGDASALWKRDKQDNSHCYCTPEDGCGDDCHNRIMAYECDSTNCPLRADQCNNRPFAELKKRARGNRYDYGVEVMETEDKGYGVRAMRTFEPHQIIVEYAGEIITQNECERRMKQVYKKDKCYYLMSFDNKMIIDATRGTIARFVNHSCEPNCEMIKWTVGGEPRMALFAGRRGIMTGEELTYDYNFDPFSTKNIQECHCGTKSCRGVLGPKPKKPMTNETSSLASSLLAGTKRKLADFLGNSRGSESAPNSPKKRISANATSTKARNALARSVADRENAEKEANAHAAQIASRESRALKRGDPITRRRITTLRKTTINVRGGRVQHKVSKPGALKKPSLFFRKPAAPKDKKTLTKTTRKNAPPPPSSKAPKRTQQRDATPEDAFTSSAESDSDSPNITPASLRSANKLKPVSTSARKPAKPEPRTFVRESTDMSVPDTDSEDDGLRKAIGNIRGRKRGDAPPPRDLHRTGAGVSKRVRNEKGWFIRK